MDHFAPVSPIIIEKQYNQINALWRTEKSTHDSQIARAKENLQVSHGGPSYSQASENPNGSVFEEMVQCIKSICVNSFHTNGLFLKATYNKAREIYSIVLKGRGL